jgi:hypothetical protein
MSKSYKKWKDLINSKMRCYNAPWTESEIVFFRKAIGYCGLKDVELRSKLHDHFHDHMPKEGYNISMDQAQKGINYLRSKTYKLNGDLRKGNIFGEFERSVINNFRHFKFVGLYPQTNGTGETLGYLPVYRCIAENGCYFDYTGTAYQAIEILGVGSESLILIG